MFKVSKEVGGIQQTQLEAEIADCTDQELMAVLQLYSREWDAADFLFSPSEAKEKFEAAIWATSAIYHELQRRLEK